VAISGTIYGPPSIRITHHWLSHLAPRAQVDGRYRQLTYQSWNHCSKATWVILRLWPARRNGIHMVSWNRTNRYTTARLSSCTSTSTSTCIYWHSCDLKAEQLDKTRKGLKTCKQHNKSKRKWREGSSPLAVTRWNMVMIQGVINKGAILRVALRDRDISLVQFKRLLKTLWFV